MKTSQSIVPTDRKRIKVKGGHYPKLLLLVAAFSAISSYTCGQDNQSLEQRVATLEKQLTELKEMVAPIVRKARAEQVVSEQQRRARARSRKDPEHYSSEKLKEIETLYQSANKNLGSAEAADALKKLINKFPKANRTGCAIQYLAQSTTGEQRKKHLIDAIDRHSDCFYGNGVQVGAYSHYYLAYLYRDSAEFGKADETIRKLLSLYPNAINHKGQLLANLLKNDGWDLGEKVP